MVRLDTRFHKELIHLAFRPLNITPTATTVIWKPKKQHDTDEILDVDAFNIYFNEVPNRCYVKLNDAPLATWNKGNHMEFVHNTPKYTKFPRGYYIIEAILKDGTTMKSATLDMYPPFDEVGDKISKQEIFYAMQKHGALIDDVPVWVYAKKGFGYDLCKKCTQQGIGPLKAKCPNCLGTGFVGGYHEPVLAYGAYRSPFTKQQSNTGPRVQQELPNQLTIPAEFTIINPEDYIREVYPPFRLYCVNGVTMTEYNNLPIVQFCSLQLEESGHPLWEKPLPTFTSPKNVYYTKVREIYEKTFSSVGKEPENPFY